MAAESRSVRLRRRRSETGAGAASSQKPPRPPADRRQEQVDQDLVSFPPHPKAWQGNKPTNILATITRQQVHRRFSTACCHCRPIRTCDAASKFLVCEHTPALLLQPTVALCICNPAVCRLAIPRCTAWTADVHGLWLGASPAAKAARASAYNYIGILCGTDADSRHDVYMA